MWPKKPEEKAEDFAYADDPEFSTIRRKLARWAADNLSVIKELKPPQPPGFNNRLSANWKLPLQIAQRARGGWPDQARRAYERCYGAGTIAVPVQFAVFPPASSHGTCSRLVEQGNRNAAQNKRKTRRKSSGLGHGADRRAQSCGTRADGVADSAGVVECFSTFRLPVARKPRGVGSDAATQFHRPFENSDMDQRASGPFVS